VECRAGICFGCQISSFSLELPFDELVLWRQSSAQKVDNQDGLRDGVFVNCMVGDSIVFVL
jgi:hypothetical protein